MSETPAKRQREMKKREWREIKAERKRLRKAGLLNAEPQPPADDQAAAAVPPQATPDKTDAS